METIAARTAELDGPFLNPHRARKRPVTTVLSLKIIEPQPGKESTMNAMQIKPGPITIQMADGQPYIIKKLLSAANHKQEKGEGYRSVGLILTPRATGRARRNLCPFATKGCARSCFADFDRLAWPQVKRAAVARTLLLGRHPECFQAILRTDIAREVALAERLPMVVRLNVVSDVAWERECPGLFADFPTVQFMDYTKDISRVLDPNRPANYHLTFSRSEANEEDCHRALAAGHNVTVVFRKPPFPATFWGYPVIDGDRNDLRFLDPAPSIVALKAKGAGARRDATGFVLQEAPVGERAFQGRSRP
jgi:hypothetical protein